MASKVWDDLSMWNVDFSHVSNAFDLKRVNELELALLDAFSYEVKVSASDYAKFQLRSLKAREDFSNSKHNYKLNKNNGNNNGNGNSGKMGRYNTDSNASNGTNNTNNNTTNSNPSNGSINPLSSYEELKPLDIAGARKLQLATEKYENKMVSELDVYECVGVGVGV